MLALSNHIVGGPPLYLKCLRARQEHARLALGGRTSPNGKPEHSPPLAVAPTRREFHRISSHSRRLRHRGANTMHAARACERQRFKDEARARQGPNQHP